MYTQEKEESKVTILTFDPGDHIGWVYRDTILKVEVGGTIFNKQDFNADARHLIDLFEETPDYVVYEDFQLYAGAAQHLIHNQFYTVQIIGAIKLLCYQRDVEHVVVQAASIKKFAPPCDMRYETLRFRSNTATEHTKDAFLHLTYFERFGLKKP
jgi:hypothetical protein